MAPTRSLISILFNFIGVKHEQMNKFFADNVFRPKRFMYNELTF